MLNKLEPFSKTIEVMMMYEKERVEVTCPVCKEQEWEVLDHIRKPIVDSHLCICRSCGFISYNPQLKDIKSWYSKEVRPQDIGFISTKNAKLVNHKRMLFKYIEDNKLDIGKALDYGCSDGYVLNALIEEDLIREERGIELNPGHANWAKHVYGLDATTSDDLSQYETGSFDLIICYHVLEHIQKPDELLKEFRRILSPKGILYIGLPTLDRIDYPTRFDLLKDEHINWFTNTTLEEFLALQGFKKNFMNNTLYGTAMIFEKSAHKGDVTNRYNENIELLTKIDTCFKFREASEEYMKKGDIEVVKQQLADALRYFNDYPELIIRYASMHDSIDEQDILKEYLKHKPDFYELYVALGLSHFKVGEFDEAEAAFKKVLEMRGNNVMTLLHLGQIKYYQGDLVASVKYLNQCWNFEPYNQSSFEMLAAILAKM